MIRRYNSRGIEGIMKVIAMKERSAGNDQVGEMWIDTAIFEPTDSLINVIKWAANFSEFDFDTLETYQRATTNGRLMLSIADEPTEVL